MDVEEFEELWEKYQEEYDKWEEFESNLKDTSGAPIFVALGNRDISERTSVRLRNLDTILGGKNSNFNAPDKFTVIAGYPDGMILRAESECEEKITLNYYAYRANDNLVYQLDSFSFPAKLIKKIREDEEEGV